MISPNEVIKADLLTKDFNGILAVNGFSVSVSQGEIFGLVGPDGAGKTTAMRMLASIMDPTSGKAWVLGYDVMEQAEVVKEEIGYMSQKSGLYPDLSVVQNIKFYADLYRIPRRKANERMDKLLAISRLDPFRGRLAEHLSGGMKQKLSLICTLIHHPKVLLLDEPNNGIDPLSRRDFWRILYDLLKEKVTIFLNTTYLDEAERCNRVGLMYSGRMLASGTPQYLKTHYAGKSLEEVFIKVLSQEKHGAIHGH